MQIALSPWGPGIVYRRAHHKRCEQWRGLYFWLWEQYGKTAVFPINERLWKSAAVFFLTAGPFWIFGDETAALLFGALYAAGIFVAGSNWLSGNSYNSEIPPIEALGWSWRRAAWGSLFGLAVALVLPIFLFSQQGWLNVPLMALGIAILCGMQGHQLSHKTRPNEGTWRALRNAALGGLLAGGLLFLLVSTMIGVVDGLLLGSLLAILVLLTQGGFNGVRHFILRLLLWKTADFPLNSPALLQEACRLSLLQRVGGGYTFRHRLILEHFAQEQAALARSLDRQPIVLNDRNEIAT
ncbi:MAG: hypothetical protein AAF614_09240 [Chloroflexota bacterium]